MKRTGQIMIDNVVVKFYRETTNSLPRYSNHGDAGMDIRSNEDTSIAGFAWGVVSTGLYVVIPFGYEGQVRSRSGLAAKNPCTFFRISAPTSKNNTSNGLIFSFTCFA